MERLLDRDECAPVVAPGVAGGHPVAQPADPFEGVAAFGVEPYDVECCFVRVLGQLADVDRARADVETAITRRRLRRDR
jgi:hypothetical protein